MKNFCNTLSVLITLTYLCSCQSEVPIETSQPTQKIYIRASLPNENETRAHIIYGYGDPKNANKERFIWDEEDEINILNLSKLSECPFGVIVNATNINGNIAEFTPIDNPDFRVEQGDTILAIYGEINRVAYKDNGEVYYDERKIITIGLGSQGNKPQWIEKNPDKNSTLTYMRHNIKMYGVVIAERDGEIPEINFKHLSAFMRISFHNETGKDLYLTQLDFKYPTKSPTSSESDKVKHDLSFLNTTLYLSIEPDENEGFKLKTYEEFYNGSDVYTDNIATTINGKNGIEDAGESILNGESYELYLTTVPRIGNDSYGEKITINIIESHHTETPYSITIDNFNRVIEPGKRYWFDLVATPDNKLVFKSQYNPADYKSSGNSGEENNDQNNEDSVPND